MVPTDSSLAASSPLRQGRFVWLALICLLPRVGVMLAQSDNLRSDPDGYRQVAQNLIQFGVLGTGYEPTAIRPPLYPLLVALCESIDPGGVAALGVAQLALGLATIWGTYRLALAWGLPGRGGAVAALLVAFDPILLQQSTLVMTETLAAALAVWSLWRLTCVTRAAQPTLGQWLFTGAVLGLAALCRPTFWIWIALILVALAGGSLRAIVTGWDDLVLQRARGPAWSDRWRGIGAWLLGLVVVTMPWVVRNINTFEQPIVATTHGGYTFALGNNPYFYGWLAAPDRSPVWDSSEFEREMIAEWEAAEPGMGRDQRYDRFAYRQAWKNIRQQPADFLRSVGYRLGRFWGLMPKPLHLDESPGRRALRTLAGAWYLALFALAAVGLWLKGRSLMDLPWLFALLLVLAFTLAHAVYWSDLRMRAPIMPVLALAAALGSGQVVRRRGGR